MQTIVEPAQPTTQPAQSAEITRQRSRHPVDRKTQAAQAAQSPSPPSAQSDRAQCSPGSRTFRRARRYDKLANNFLAGVLIAAILI